MLQNVLQMLYGRLYFLYEAPVLLFGVTFTLQLLCKRAELAYNKTWKTHSDEGSLRQKYILKHTVVSGILTICFRL